MMPRSSANPKVEHSGKGQTNAFAVRLRAAMEERGWTAGETARRVREYLGDDATFTPANISHYRQGRSLPHPKYLEALSVAFGIDTRDFLAPSGSDHDGNGAIKISTKAEPAKKTEPAIVPAPSAAELPALHLEDRNGGVWLQINQQLSWPTAIKILQALKGDAELAQTA